MSETINNKKRASDSVCELPAKYAKHVLGLIELAIKGNLNLDELMGSCSELAVVRGLEALHGMKTSNALDEDSIEADKIDAEQIAADLVALQATLDLQTKAAKDKSTQIKEKQTNITKIKKTLENINNALNEAGFLTAQNQLKQSAKKNKAKSSIERSSLHRAELDVSDLRSVSDTVDEPAATATTAPTATAAPAPTATATATADPADESTEWNVFPGRDTDNELRSMDTDTDRGSETGEQSFPDSGDDPIG
jgi:hypothetical protein